MIINAAEAYKTVWHTIRPEIVARKVRSFFTLECAVPRWDRGAYVYDLSATLEYVGKAESFDAEIMKIDIGEWTCYGTPLGIIFKETIVVGSGNARGV